MSKVNAIIKQFIPGPWRDGVKRAALKFKYYGHQYYCPVCDAHTRKQKPLGLDLPVIREKQIIGGGYRMALCPVCNSSDRIRLLFLFLKLKTTLFREPTKLLHFAPEPALQKLFEKKENIQYLTADLYQENVMEKIDITQIPYSDNTFDAILCNHVLEHIPDDGLAMRELFRVLKPGGFAILQVPFSNILETTFEDPTVVREKEREVVFGQKDHVRIYGKDYTKRLATAGFNVQVFESTKDQEAAFQDPKINLNRDEPIFYCLK